MLIVKQDTNGTKPLLETGELGYDNYPVGGDAGRVYVGTGAENIALASKQEVLDVDNKADTHISRIDNPHSVTKAQVGLGNVDNTADSNKSVLSATKWTTARTIALVGDVAGSVSVDGSANVSITTTVADDSHNHVISNVDGLQEVFDDTNLLRADKYLAAQNVVNMSYDLNGKLEKVQYNNATDVDYEVLTYNVDGKLSNVAHYVDGVLQGNTVLSYSDGRLVSAPFIAV